MLPNLLNTLNWWQWTLLATIPPAIIALYFLKLKREPLEVPSTYLWLKSIEDLHVNSIWQRLRQNLLLFLQLLLVALAMLAVLRPGWRGTALSGDRFIFLIDHSASMSATDVEPNRLAESKRRVLELIQQMGSGSKAMIISFSDEAQVVQNFTDNRRLLRERLQSIEPTGRPTSVLGALQFAAGLANPGRIATDAGDQQVADAQPATMYIFSDGKFSDVETRDFALGNLKPIFVPIGQQGVANIAITAFSTRQHESYPDRQQVFGQLENRGSEDIDVAVDLLWNGELIDADEVHLEAGGSSGIAFDLGDLDIGELQLRVHANDHLDLDNRAYAAVNAPRRGRVLLVTPGNEAIQWALVTEKAGELAEVEVARPEILGDESFKKDAASGQYDLIIFDQCRPEEELPQANTLFIGRLPPLATWQGDKEAKTVVTPQIIDTDQVHPLMQLVEVSDVLIGESLALDPPLGSNVLIDSNRGKLFAIGPRGGFEDAVLGFEIIHVANGEAAFNTNWPGRLSFPTFFLNVLQYLGGGQHAEATLSARPGRPVQIKSVNQVEQIEVVKPDGRTVDVSRGRHGAFQFHGTDRTGVYLVKEEGEVTQRFAVNLFDRAESDISPRPKNTIQIGYVDVEGQAGWEPARQEIWKILLFGALVVLLLEWYIYNRRVYI